MKKLSVFMLILVGAFAAGSVSAQVLNGNFEGGTDPGSFTTVYAGDSNIANWTVTAGSVDYIGSYWLGASGPRSIDLNGFTTGSISQSLTTVPGVTYLVSFDMSGNPDSVTDVSNPYFSPAEKAMAVTANGGSSQTYTFTTGSNSLGSMQWVLKTYTFTATGNSTVLAFASQIPGAFGPALDNVIVTAISGSRVCHRDNGKPGAKTLTVGASAVAAHLAHGDTVGPCPAPVS